MSLIWKGISIGLCGFVINFAIHGIRINAAKPENVFSDIVAFNTIQIWLVLLVYILFVENVDLIKLLIFTCSIFGLGWSGFAFDYYSTQYNLIKYFNSCSIISLILYILTLLILLFNTPITLNVIYFIFINLAIFFASNGLMNVHVGKKITLMYP